MRLIRETERAKMTGVPRSTWYLRMRQGKAPQPVSLGDNSVAWVESELQDWIAARILERNAAMSFQPATNLEVSKPGR